VRIKGAAMMVDKRDFLFRFVPQAIRACLQLDEEALYSTTDQVTARKICDELGKFVPCGATVVDATACIGGLTYTLTNAFTKVIAIEIDPNRYSYLCNNMELLSVSSAVTCILGDALTACKNLNAAAIIIDPPWGGPEYKNMETMRLQLGGLDLADVCIRMYLDNPAVQVIAVKVPVNFDEECFRQSIEPHGIHIVHKARLRKMCLLIMTR
jgi:predicted RNA methylase